MPHIVGMEEADGLVVGAMTDRAGTVIPAARRLRTRNFIQLFKPVRLENCQPYRACCSLGPVVRACARRN